LAVIAFHQIININFLGNTTTKFKKRFRKLFVASIHNYKNFSYFFHCSSPVDWILKINTVKNRQPIEMSTKFELEPAPNPNTKENTMNTQVSIKRKRADFYMELDIVTKQPLHIQRKLENCIQDLIDKEVNSKKIIWAIENLLE
jgi:hypothetical protein